MLFMRWYEVAKHRWKLMLPTIHLMMTGLFSGLSLFTNTMLATAYTHLAFEIVRHDMKRDEALSHMKFVSDLLYPGWKDIYGIN